MLLSILGSLYLFISFLYLGIELFHEGGLNILFVDGWSEGSLEACFGDILMS